MTGRTVSLYFKSGRFKEGIKMKVSEVLKCVAQGVSVDDVKDIIAEQRISADEAIELVKAGYSSKTLQGVLDAPEPEPQPAPQPDPKLNEEIENLKKQLEETQNKLVKAQQANLRQDAGPGEKPDPEEYLAKLFAE